MGKRADLPAERRRLFQMCTKWSTADWYELLLPPPPRLVVPGGCLITGGDGSWRRETVW